MSASQMTTCTSKPASCRTRATFWRCNLWKSPSPQTMLPAGGCQVSWHKKMQRSPSKLPAVRLLQMAASDG